MTFLFSLLEFVDHHDVGKGHYRLIDACVYVLLTAPARLLQLMPAAMLFACLFALGGLAARAELTVMRAAGISPGRIVGTVFKLAAAILVALFLLAQFVIPPAQELAQAQRATRLSTVDAVRSNGSFWAAGDHQFLNVRRFANANVPIDIYLMNLPPTARATEPDPGRPSRGPLDGTWLLEGVS